MSQMLLFPDPRPLVERLGLAFFRQAPQCAGVYLMRDAADTVLYVGKAKNLKRRLGHYRVANPERMPRRHLGLLRAVESIQLEECPDEASALAREAELLRLLRPRFNRAGTWPRLPRFFAWRATGEAMQLAIAQSFDSCWQSCGPLGYAAFTFRIILVRLLWGVLYPERGLGGMPPGWFAGHYGAVITIPYHPRRLANFKDAAAALEALFAGDADHFTEWVRERRTGNHTRSSSPCGRAILSNLGTWPRRSARSILPFQQSTPGASDRLTRPVSTLDFGLFLTSTKKVVGLAFLPESLQARFMLRRLSKRGAWLLVLVFSAAEIVAQTRTNSSRWEAEIEAFEASDRTNPPPRDAILFIGSSSIRLWKTMALDFAGKPVINRGFGGSQIPDATAFASRIIFPYHPRLIVLYAGDNDLAAGKSPEQVVSDYRVFMRTIRARLPETRIAFLSIKPSPSRWHLNNQMKQVNGEISAMKEKGFVFIDIYPLMLGSDGKPRSDLFMPDGLHPNAKAYQLWVSVIEPYLN